jgi:hypothetical protein
MELFLPSILVIIFAALVIMLVIPNFSPLIIVILSVILLTASSYHHFHFFWHEYRDSTWQTNLKIFAPGIIIAAVFIYIFVAGSSFFTSGSMPSMPSMELPSASTATNSITSAINSSMSAVSSATSAVSNTLTNSLGLGASNQGKRNNGSLARSASSGSKGPTTSTLAVL